MCIYYWRLINMNRRLHLFLHVTVWLDVMWRQFREQGIVWSFILGELKVLYYKYT